LLTATRCVMASHIFWMPQSAEAWWQQVCAEGGWGGGRADGAWLEPH
jgi:hypothetical protein